MATLSNQTTNLSTLCTALTSLCQELKAPFPLEQEHAIDHEKDEIKHDEAEHFLDSLIERVDDVDDALMKSTEYLLPPLSGRGETSRMTATELSQVLKSIHAMNAQKIGQIQSLLAGSPSLEERNGELVATDSAKKGGNTPHHWSIGLPLEQVDETDNETDRNSYTSGASIRSLSFSHTPSRSVPGTPSTPTIRGLRLSASTTKILTKDLIDADSPEPSRLNERSMHSTGEEYLDREDDALESARKSLSNSMASLQTTLEKATSSSSATGIEAIRNQRSASQTGREDCNSTTASVRSHRLEDASVASSRRFSDDDCDSVDESTLCPTVATVVAKDRRIAAEQEQIRRSMSINDEDETLAESTICPTVVAQPAETTSEESEYAGGQNDLDEDESDEKHMLFSPQPPAGHHQIFRNQHDISHVLVQGDASPSHTLLTMDATMLYQDPDGMSQYSQMINDAASLGEETPVLDRYRIIPDDSSVGFKVMPNERGSSRKSKFVLGDVAAVNLQQSMSNLPNVPKSVKFQGRHAESTETRTAYRKTPYPGVAFAAALDETETSANEESSLRFDLPMESTKRTTFYPVMGGAANKSPSLHFATSPQTGEKWSSFRRSPYRLKDANSVRFESPNVSTRTKLFRKTPLPKSKDGNLSDDESPVPLRSSSKLRLDASSMRFDTSTRTPAKRTTTSYRKTPHQKLDARSALQGVTFGSDTQFQSTTPANGERKMYRRTPYRNNKDKLETSTSFEGRPIVQFEGHHALKLTPLPIGGRASYRKTPFRKKVPAKSPARDENLAENASSALHDSKPSASKAQFFRSPLAELSPARVASSTPQHIRLMNNELLRSPGSLASTLTGITALTHIDNQRELFPAPESMGYSKQSEKEPRKSDFSVPQKSSIQKIKEGEFEEADEILKSQHSMDVLNQAIEALNGRAFLRKASGAHSLTVQFIDDEAHEILKKCGVKSSRKRAKLLKALICWNRLKVHRVEDETDVFGTGVTEYFEVVEGY